MARPTVYARGIRTRIAEALKDTPVVLVNGPRQSGKTTLIRQYASDRRPYLTLDDSATLATARDDPQGFIQRLDSAVIDEVQRVPELLLAIKLSVDRNRRPGRFLITGSADVMALPRVSDSLAGRIEVLTLLPLAGAELTGSPGRWPDAVFAALAAGAAMPAVSQSKASKHTGDALERRVLQGGYPEALQREDARRRNAWTRGYIDSVLKRDVRDIAAAEKLDQMPRLLFALAQMAGQLCNYTQLGGQLGLDAKTAQKYVTMLEQLFLVRRVPAWSGNALSRVVKTPKIQFLDSGLLCSVLKLDEAGIARNRGAFGHALECYVYGELMRQCSWADDTYEVLMYRDRDQVEVDIVLENAAHHVVGVEVKAAAGVQSADLAGLKKLAALAGKRFVGGVVLYDGINTLPMGDAGGKPLWAVPLSTLWLT
jgi:predicted AAA+ superfamily ATPase